MDVEKPHRTTSTPITTTTTSELFICFTSRLSKSSSLRLSSKSIHSPSRTTTAANKSTQPLSLSTSLSRRLHHNGSLRGGQSPVMFPSKKSRGSSGFSENPEPSSPKVTCIGQVRVKTKKHGNKIKMRACRNKRLSGGGASFRRIEHPHEGLTQVIKTQQSQECGLNHRNQRWVHLPFTICEALRAFGNEFSCLFPCKSSCFSSGGVCGGEKGEKTGEKRENGANSCAVFRWLVSLQEGGGEGEGKRRDIELVVGGEEIVERQVRGESIIMERECSRRRSIFDDMEFDDLFNNIKNEEGEIDNDNGGGDEESGARVSICIPPKNALLLMRCRSDPMKMASLSPKLWEAPLPQHDDNDEEEEEEEEEKEEEEEEEEREECVVKEEEIEELFVEESGKIEEMVDVLAEADENLPCFIGDEEQHEYDKLEEELETEQKCEIPQETHVITDENLENGSSIEMITVENEQELTAKIQVNHEQLLKEMRENVEIDKISSEVLEEESNPTFESSDVSCVTTSSSNSSEKSTAESKERDPIEVQLGRKSMEENQTILPDCLLLMMCEPKVSMEVSKETWVCSSDFLRRLPERHPKKVGNKLDGSDDSTKNKKPPPVQRLFQQANQHSVEPARSSISFPAGGGSVANLIDQKLMKGGSGGYEPLVLTRCKSAPIRSAAAKVAPSEMTCSLWGKENGRKLEPHRPATFGFGAAGVGF